LLTSAHPAQQIVHCTRTGDTQSRCLAASAKGTEGQTPEIIQGNRRDRADRSGGDAVKIIAPKINLNGTDGRTLEEWHYRVISEFQKLLELMTDIEPNGRDYVHNASGDYEAARKQHVYRLAQLQKLRDEITLIHSAIVDQNVEREARRVYSRPPEVKS
jgi:hypothetical protein